MEFNVSSAELLKGLSDVARAIPAKSPISILENFLFAIKDDKLEITASDQELTLRTILNVDVKEEGSMAVPAHFFQDHFRQFFRMHLGERKLFPSFLPC